jgi:hypothetical protein
MNVAGPVFVSIGDIQKLEVFFEKNPRLPREQLLLDIDLRAYKTMGYGQIMQDMTKTAQGAKNIKMPKFGFKRWSDYLTSAGKLVPKDEKGVQLQGVLQLGGTLAIDGSRILFSYEDAVPGDHPAPDEVLRVFSK